MSIRVVFMGSPDFSLSSLRLLAQHYQVVGVVTQPDRASGRGRELKAPPVKLLAQELNIPIIQPEKLREPEAMQQLREWSPDLIVVAAFGQILKKDVLDLPKYGCINVHSLLPQPEEGATYASMLKKEDGHLNFNHSAVELERRIRAMNPWPGAWFEWNENILKVMRGSVGEARGKEVASRLIVEGRPAVMCADGVLILEEVQPPGKKVMSGKAFLSGAREWQTA